MKAITVYQPWASLIAVGAKKYETRSWSTNYRGPIAIHAGKKPFTNNEYTDGELYPFAYALNLPDIYSFDTLTLGAVIATAELVDCHKIIARYGDNHPCIHYQPFNAYMQEIPIIGNELLLGDWTPGRYAWELTNVKMLPEPIPVRGQQGLWEWKEQLK